MRTKNLLKGKPECGSRGLAAVLLSFGFTLAVIAASGMVPAGCDSLTGNGGAVSPEITASAPGVSGGALLAADYVSGMIKTINVKFEVKNGGTGLIKSRGIVSRQNDSYLVIGGASFANDFVISIIVPKDETYLNIRWEGEDFWHLTYLKAGIPLAGAGRADYTIVLDYNGHGKVATKNLSDVRVNTNDAGNDFHNALARVRGPLPDDLRRITVKFEVLSGARRPTWSWGIVSTPDDSFLVKHWAEYSFDYTITVTVPADTEYLNVRWYVAEGFDVRTYVKAKVKAENGTITLDYNGKGKVATKNLYDVTVGTNANADMKNDFDDAWKLAGR